MLTSIIQYMFADMPWRFDRSGPRRASNCNVASGWLLPDGRGHVHVSSHSTGPRGAGCGAVASANHYYFG